MRFIIDVRNMSKLESEQKVSGYLDKIADGSKAEILANDQGIMESTPDMLNSIQKAEYIKSWQGNDDYYHSLIKKY